MRYAKFKDVQIKYSIDVFILSVSVFEVLVAIFTSRLTYRYHILTNNLSILAVSPLRMLLALPLAYFYVSLFEMSRAWHFGWDGSIWWQWLLCFVLIDLNFYIYHVVAHSWNVVWGGHLLHHLSTDLNLSVGGLEALTEVVFRRISFLPLAIVGVPLEATILVSIFSHASMYWLHSEAIGKLGWLEYIIVTPSQHRVHHYKLTDEHAKTKNFGGVLSIWDRIFGTFKEEENESREYGISGFSPTLGIVASHTLFYMHLIKVIRKARGLEKLKLLFSDRMPEPVPQAAQEFHSISIRSSDFWYVLITIYCSTHIILSNTIRIIRFINSSSFFDLNLAVWGSINALALALVALLQMNDRLSQIRQPGLVSGLVFGTIIYIWAADIFFFGSKASFISVFASSRVLLFLCIPDVLTLLQGNALHFYSKIRKIPIFVND